MKRLTGKGFQRMLEREYCLDRADRLTDEYVRVNKEQTEAIRAKFKKYLTENIK